MILKVGVFGTRKWRIKKLKEIKSFKFRINYEKH